MSANEDTIPRDVLLDGAGHLTEVGATLLADGEEALLPPDVHAHATGCDECVKRVGEAALLSESIGNALREERAVRTQVAAAATVHEAFEAAGVSTRHQRTFPMGAVAAALVVAAMGLVPSLARGGARAESLVHTITVLAKTFALVARHGATGPTGALLTCAAATVLAAMSVLVVRRLPRVAMAGRGA